jgi:hypothetical protein
MGRYQGINLMLFLSRDVAQILILLKGQIKFSISRFWDIELGQLMGTVLKYGKN